MAMLNNYRLILGTAEFNPKGYGGKPPIEKREILRILACAHNNGIKLLDTADTYGTEALEPYFVGFGKLFKSRTAMSAFYHYQPLESPIEGLKMASVYEIEQMDGLNSVIAPLNIDDTRFLEYHLTIAPRPTFYARSVFGRGRLLDMGYTVKDCIDFVKRQSIEGIIVGVNTVAELEEILKAY